MNRTALVWLLVVGVLAVLGIFSAMVGSDHGAGGSPAAASTASTHPADYENLCVLALTNVQFSAHVLEGAEVVPGVDPKILEPGPPPRVQCGIASGDYIGAVTFDAVCMSWQDTGCARPTAAVMDGRVVYIGPEAQAALARAASPHHRHHRAG